MIFYLLQVRELPWPNSLPFELERPFVEKIFFCKIFSAEEPATNLSMFFHFLIIYIVNFFFLPWIWIFQVSSCSVLISWCLTLRRRRALCCQMPFSLLKARSKHRSCVHAPGWESKPPLSALAVGVCAGNPAGSWREGLFGAFPRQGWGARHKHITLLSRALGWHEEEGQEQVLLLERFHSVQFKVEQVHKGEKSCRWCMTGCGGGGLTSWGGSRNCNTLPRFGGLICPRQGQAAEICGQDRIRTAGSEGISAANREVPNQFNCLKG